MLDQLRLPLTAVLLAMVIGIFGCAGSGSAASESQQAGSKRDRYAPLSEYEATLNPAEYDQEVDVIEKDHANDAADERIEIPVDTSTVSEEIVQGFRIQVFSSSNIDEANAARLSALEQFTADSVYLIYDPPVYKVRVGDFLQRFDANSRLQEFVALGYRDAWIVPDRVVKRGKK